MTTTTHVRSEIRAPFYAECCRRLVLLTIAAALGACGSARAQELMPASGTSWTAFSARPETAPAVSVSGTTPYQLSVSGNGRPNVYGGWRTRLEPLGNGGVYRFHARVVATALASPRESLTILLRWRGAFGDEMAPTYVWEYQVQPDGSLLFDRTIQAPTGTSAVDVELVLQWAAEARVEFSELSFKATAAPASRPVKVVAMSYRPSGTSSGLESVQRAERYGEQIAAGERPDVMVFGELLNVIGTAGTYDQKGEAIPGPSSDTMATLARGFNTYVAFGMLEREGAVLYNAAVLLDRSGSIVGKYRKSQLPLAEVSAGISPGADVRVFQTDFGKVGLLICQDTAFPEPVRQAAIQGAELLLVPIWGGKPAVMAARAIEHAVYIAASGYDYKSEVLDPLGSALARVPALNTPDAAVATIDLARVFREDWTGDWRDTAGKQRRSYPSVEWRPPANQLPPPPQNIPPSIAVTAPASGASFTAPATISIVAAAADNDGTIAQVQFYAGGALIGTRAASPYSVTWSSVPAGTHTITARATDDAGAVTTSSAVTITVTSTPPPSALQAPWSAQDIGAVGVAGAATYSNGAFNVRGAGADIWGSADAFHFVWQSIDGDVDLVARVAAVENVAAWVKAGIMIRERLTPDSAHSLMLVSAAKGLAFQRRVATGGPSTSTSGIAGAAPIWLRLQRRGATITAFYSTDGAAWTVMGSDSLAMPSSVYVGLAVSSHSTTQAATAAFDSVSVQRVAPAAVWQTQDIGAVGVAGDARTDGSVFTVRGGGADIWGAADAFRYMWRPLHGDGTIVARVASVENVAAWVKAGVMIRESLAPDAAHGLLLVSAGKGLAFQRRVSGGGLTTSTSGGPGVAPGWVKLERRGDVITASRSGDGVNWTVVGSDTFTMGPDVLVGLAVSSHDTTRLATVTFDEVSVR